MKYTAVVILSLFLSSCISIPGVPDSIQGKNLAKTGATTAITYAISGPVPALLNLGASIVIDEMIEDDEPKIEDIKSNKQLVAYIWSEFKDMILYGAVVLLLFTTVISPWAVQRRSRRRMKFEQYKAEAKAARELNLKLAEKNK